MMMVSAKLNGFVFFLLGSRMPVGFYRTAWVHLLDLRCLPGLVGNKGIYSIGILWGFYIPSSLE